MINKYYKNDEMVILKENFKSSIFTKLFEKYDYKFLAKKLCISNGSLYRYKNKMNVTIPRSIVNKLVGLTDTIESELDDNIIKIFKPGELRQKGLNFGREFREQQLKKWKAQIPNVKNLVENNSLNVEKWLSFYRKLIDFGSRTIEKIEVKDNKIIINHRNYVKGKQKKYRIILPTKIRIDNDFQYFFGLWCGDRAGGGRLGILNKNIELIHITEGYLKKLYQKPHFVLFKSSRTNKIPHFDMNITHVHEVKNMPGNWVLCAQSVNGILKTFFHHLLKDLDIFLDLLPNKNIFFAGLFDAEGNVHLEDNCFRWACKNLEEVSIYKKHLKQYKLFQRYDGSSLITNNVKAFSELIFPHLKHKEKINKARLICFGRGYLDERFKNILIIIKNNQGKTISELAEIMNRKKLWSQIRVLEKYKYIICEGYPKKVYISMKGLKELRGGRTMIIPVRCF